MEEAFLKLLDPETIEHYKNQYRSSPQFEQFLLTIMAEDERRLMQECKAALEQFQNEYRAEKREKLLNSPDVQSMAVSKLVAKYKTGEPAIKILRLTLGKNTHTYVPPDRRPFKKTKN